MRLTVTSQVEITLRRPRLQADAKWKLVVRVVEDAESRLSEAIETASTLSRNRYNIDTKEMSEMGSGNQKAEPGSEIETKCIVIPRSLAAVSFATRKLSWLRPLR